ncbi:PHP domain-containing protein [Candidatus Bipolaricaulota bacterium]|nr:PHP domain-containing protein [Candidatus Bipolaricaulota bacterium]
MQRWVDLHLHTKWSDGTLDVVATARRAKNAGAACIAITDHDTVGPELLRPHQVIEGIGVICGVEIKAEVAGVRAEILGYFVRPGHPALEELFSRMRRARVERMQAMIARCNELLGTDITYAEVAARATGSVGRPHLAAALVERGLVDTIREAFETYIGNDRPCYVPLPRAKSEEVIGAIRAAGGVAALAHPGFLAIEDWEGVLLGLKDQGMEALEVYYPYELSTAPVYIGVPELERLAKRLGLVATGGSDDHGPGSGKEYLGRIKLPYAVVEELAALAPSTA